MNNSTFLLLVRGAIASLSKDEQKAVTKAAKEIRGVIEKHGAPGRVALSLVVTEITVEEEGK